MIWNTDRTPKTLTLIFITAKNPNSKEILSSCSRISKAFFSSDYKLKNYEFEVFPNNNLKCNYFAIKDYEVFESEEELCKDIKGD